MRKCFCICCFPAFPHLTVAQRLSVFSSVADLQDFPTDCWSRRVYSGKSCGVATLPSEVNASVAGTVGLFPFVLIQSGLPTVFMSHKEELHGE